ncbi:sulfatase-like hydrolase/transferase [bacterium]|nr:sulfatase-like hydrolase/transferase [bacterium]
MIQTNFCAEQKLHSLAAPLMLKVVVVLLCPLMFIGCVEPEIEVVFDFYDHVFAAYIDSQRSDTFGVRRSTLNLKKDLRDYIIQPAGTTISYYLKLAPGSIIRFGAGMDMIDWDRTLGIDLSLVIKLESGQSEVLFHQYFNPLKNKEQWSWIDRSIDLSRYGAQICRFDFISSCQEPVLDNSKIGWSRPQIIVKQRPSSDNLALVLNDSFRSSVPQPNIVWLCFSAQLNNKLGLYGQPATRTPNFDYLGRRSTTFQDVVSPSFHEIPTLASLLTGLYGIHHKVNRVNAHYHQKSRTLAELVRHQGYGTLYVTNQTLMEPRFGLSDGFEESMYSPTNREIDRFPGSNIASILSSIDDWLIDRFSPFFIFIYEDNSSILQQKEHDLSVQHSGHEVDESESSVPQSGRTVANDPLVSMNDRDVGAFLRFLDQRGLLSKTVVLVCGTSSRPTRPILGKAPRHGAYISQTIPLMIKFPALPFQNRIVSKRISGCDIVPTLHHFLSIPQQRTFDGSSFLPNVFSSALCNPMKEGRYVFIDSLPQMGSLIFHDDKLDYLLSDNEKKVLFHELYLDPYEHVDIEPRDNYYLNFLTQEFLRFSLSEP